MAEVVAEQPKLTIEQAMQLAHEHWDVGQAPQAEELCRRILGVSPNNPDAHHLLGMIAHQYNNAEAALKHMRLACEAPRLPALYAANLAELCRQQGLHEEAEKAARRAVAIDERLIKGHYTLGIVLQERGRYTEALDCLKVVSLATPDDIDCLNALANTYQRLGDLVNAEKHYGMVIERKPEHADAHSNLSFLYAALGRYEAAAAAARRAIEIEPTFHAAYLNLAQAELSRGRYGHALAVLDSLRAFAPRYAPGLIARATVLHAQERFHDAEASALTAIEIAPHSADARLAAARACQSLGNTEKALEHYEKAAALPGTVGESAMIGIAAALLEAGRRDEAFAAFDRVLAAYPRSIAALSMRANAKHFSKDDADIGLLKGIAAQGSSLRVLDRVKANFALGKAHLDFGDAKEAFGYFEVANKLKRGTFTYDSGLTGQWMDRIAAAFPRDLFEQFANAGISTQMPVFVIGMPRSGTSLVEQILASNRKVTGAGELSAFGQIVEECGSYPEFMQRMTSHALEAIGNRYLSKVVALANGADRVIDKMPGNFLYAGLIALALPGARIIHCRRDPVDTCLSCYTREFGGNQHFAYDMTELGEFYGFYERLMAHWRGLLPVHQFAEVRYEDLVANLEGEARRLTDFIGLPWDEASLAFHASDRVVRTASFNEVRQPVYTTAIGRAREYQSELGPLLAALGASA
ncbi:tetratricopeptide repeat-containing sulfotransferase family protein [Paraburkholderia youngii]|uniref:tetratricopeptide repeat-containing sulfotransferase family protein n=1 Tax=Paraburkholderia youngii TaxID=2782701 RepID=UPI003D1E0146